MAMTIISSAIRIRTTHRDATMMGNVTNRPDEIIEISNVREGFHHIRVIVDDRQTNPIDVEHDQRVHCKGVVREVHGTGSNVRQVHGTASNDPGVLSVPIEMKMIEIVIEQICEPIGGLDQGAEMMLTIVAHLRLRDDEIVSQRSAKCRLKT